MRYAEPYVLLIWDEQARRLAGTLKQRDIAYIYVEQPCKCHTQERSSDNELTLTRRTNEAPGTFPFGLTQPRCVGCDRRVRQGSGVVQPQQTLAR